MPRGKLITTAIFFNKYKPQKDGACPISIRVTFNKEKKYYDTGKRMTYVEYEKIYSLKPKPQQKAILSSLKNLEEKAQGIISSLGEAFTFQNFDRQFLSNKSISDSLEKAFDDYITSIEPERIGTIMYYQTAKQSFKKFSPKARIYDITVRYLKDYESWMIENGKSISTVGIYARGLRSVLNGLIADGKLNQINYPFGNTKQRKYEIPASKNTKKALALEEIGKIFHYKCEPGSVDEMCRDYWFFLYLANGINVQDFCLLKWKNIQGEWLSFVREKTVRTKKQIESIQVVMQPEMRTIISKWGTKAINKEAFIFPHLSLSMAPLEIKNKVKVLIALINNHMKKIARLAGIEKDITTYFARHSFATILKNSGAPVAMISQALGHSSMATTQNYLSSFETDQLKEAITALTAFKSHG